MEAAPGVEPGKTGLQSVPLHLGRPPFLTDCKRVAFLNAFLILREIFLKKLFYALISDSPLYMNW